jgi:drug/metabolite transporter (DMT)-like permease
MWVFLFLGEAMGRFALFGGLIVLAGVLSAPWDRRNQM